MKNIRLLFGCILSTVGIALNAHAQNNIIETIAGTSGFCFSGCYAGDGSPASASGTVKMSSPYMIAMTTSGDIYIADNGNDCVRKITAATGIISTVAGIGTSGGFAGDGGPATAAKLGASGGPNPGVVGVAVDAAGNNLYICDGTNNRIRQVVLSTGIINTIAGNGTAGFAGDGGPATAATCELSAPRGIAVDGVGNVYFTDAGTNRVRMINASGIITTLAGNGAAGYTADGVVATTTNINAPRGLAVDGSGNVYFADMTNNRIRKIAAGTDIITTVAGNGTGGFAGDGGMANAATCEVKAPTDVRLDGIGNLYIADASNNRIRMVNTSGIISTIAGSASAAGWAGDGGLATAAAVKMNGPASVVTTADGRLIYISDRTNNVLREVKPNSIPYFFAGTSPLSLVVCENTVGDSLNTLLQVMDSDRLQTLNWSLVTGPANGTLGATATAATTGGVVTPTGLYYTPTPGFSGTDNFVIQVSDGLATTQTTVHVTVNPLPVVAAITGLSSVCVGASIVLGETTGGGTWSESTGNTSVTGGTVMGLVAGTDVISYAVPNSCGTTTVTTNITVNPNPDAGTIAGPSTVSVCTGSSIVLTDGTPGGTWSASNGNASVVGGTVTGITATTTDVITYSVSNVCGTATASVTVNVITLLGVGTTLTGLSTVCVGSNIVLASTVAGGAWSETTGNASVTGGTVTGVSAGTDVINYALTNACGTNTITKAVTINPLPNAGTITGLSSVCLAGTTPLGETASGGTWSASNTHATVTGTGTVTGVTVGSDVISYSVSNSCGLAVATLTMNVVSSPSAGVITGTPTVCQGGTSVLGDATAGGAWTASNANASVAGGTVTGVTAGTDVITYTIATSCGTAHATMPITINPLPTPAAISGSSYVCLGSATTLTDVTAGGTWSAQNTNASVSTTGSVTGLIVGSDVINYSVTNACGTTTVTVNISIDAIVTPSVTFSASPGFTTCPLTSVTYTPNPVNGGGAPTYEWVVNTSPLGTGAAFIYTPVNGDHIFCKMSSSLGCISAATVTDTVTVVVNPTLVPTVHIASGITGDTLCTGNTVTMTATGTNGGTAPTYQWNVNGSIYSFTNPFSYVPANGDVVTCSYTSNYACPMPATVTSNSVALTVNTTETPTIYITVTPGSSICSGSDATFTVHSLYGGPTPFYRWTKNGVNVATGPEYIYMPLNGDGVYAMLASSATCSTLDSVFSNTIIMSTALPTTIAVTIHSSNGTVAVNQNDTLTAVVTGPASPTYQWFVNGTAIAGATSSTYVVSSALAGSELINCVAGTGDACANTAISNVLSVNFSDVGVAQLSSTAGSMQLLPNPNKGRFTMNLVEDLDEAVHVVITNTVGEKVMEMSGMTNQPTEISLNQPTGIYFLTATTVHGRSVAKVVVE